MKLALVRYGDHENGHLNEKGRETMIKLCELLKPLVVDKRTCIVSANIPRAIESAEVISEKLKISPIKTFDEFYAAEEDGVELT